jgi:hypothetical protein
MTVFVDENNTILLGSMTQKKVTCRVRIQSDTVAGYWGNKVIK